MGFLTKTKLILYLSRSELNEKWRLNLIVEGRLQEQLQKLFSNDKSENYGIPTNLFVVNKYLENLFKYVIENGKQLRNKT